MGAAMLMLAAAAAQPNAAPDASEEAYRRELEREAALNLIYLQRAIERDGFYSARIALNVWRRSAIDAGTFDPALHAELKLKLYEKSVADSLACYRLYLNQNDYPNARTCLLIWRRHASEIDRFDPAVYQELLKALNQLKKKP